MIKIFVGYDPKESIAYHTCVNSIIRHASQPISICPLALNLLPMYTETHTDGSTEFSYSRFLVPHLMEFNGPAIYLDCDIILKEDISKLWNMYNDQYAVQVVKHNYSSTCSKKFLNNQNNNYPRKNWTSVMIFNCSRNTILQPEFVQSNSGEYLHRLSWLDESSIGELPITWNWLPDEYGVNDDALLIHYTLGTPCFHDFADSNMADLWHKERILTTYALQI